MRTRILPIVLASALIGLLSGCDDIANTDIVGYAYPSIANIAAMSYTRATQNGKNNLPVHHRELVDHKGASGVVSPNNDTLYTGISLDLRHSPQIVELPVLNDNRYQSIMATDMQAYNIAEFVNSGSGGRYLFAVKGYQGEVPQDIQFIEAESDAVLVLIRTEVLNHSDLPNIHKIQDQIKVSPLLDTENNITVHADLPKVDPEDLKMSVLNNWVEMAQWAMRHSPKLDTRDAAYKEQINRLKPGLLNKLVFAFGVYRLRKDGASMTSTKGLYGSRTNVTEDHWRRGAITTVSHLALSHKRAAYPTLNFDSTGSELVGCQAYTVTLKDVPAKAFWSFSVYQESDKQFVPNEQKKYRISDKTAITNHDGSVFIHLGGDSAASNYLPLPKDCANWYAILRLYEPDKSYRDGIWKVPSIVKDDSTF